jgi:hypothetical protein
MSTTPKGKYHVSSAYKDHLIHLVNNVLATQERMYEHLSKMEYRQARKARKDYHQAVVNFKTTCFMELSGYETAANELKRSKR